MSLQKLSARLDEAVQELDPYQAIGIGHIHDKLADIASKLKTISHQGLFQSTERERRLIELAGEALAKAETKTITDSDALVSWFNGWQHRLREVVQAEYGEVSTPTVAKTIENMGPVLRHVACLFIAADDVAPAQSAMEAYRAISNLYNAAELTDVGDGPVGRIGVINFKEEDDAG